MTAFENISAFLQEIKAYCSKFGEPIESGYCLTLNVPVELTQSDRCFDFFRFYFALLRKLGLVDSARIVADGKTVIQGTRPVQGWSQKALLSIRIDIKESYFESQLRSQLDATVKDHKSRLKNYFNSGITKAQLEESIGFLLDQGWSPEQFQQEIGLSQITLYRYRKALKSAAAVSAN